MRKLGLVALSVGLSVLACEAALRLVGIGAAGRGSPWFAGGSHPRFLFQPDPAAGYALRPGFRGVEVASSGEFVVFVAIDAEGRRDRVSGPEPIAGSGATVLALGDSMTFGEGVAAEETYAALLEPAVGARVWNGGVPGYGSPQMAARLERYAPRLHPDLVLVTLQPSWDVGRCLQPFVYRDGFIVASGYLDRLYLVGGNLYASEVSWPVVAPALARLKGHSHLARLALPAMRELANRLKGRGSPAGSPPDFSCSVAALSRARRAAEGAGARFLVVLAEAAPGAEEGPEHRDQPLRRDNVLLESALAREGISVVSLDRLLGPGGGVGLRYPRDGHWNAAGHRRVAELLAPELARRLAGAKPAGAGGPLPLRPSEPAKPVGAG